jgi:hypothetical protein
MERKIMELRNYFIIGAICAIIFAIWSIAAKSEDYKTITLPSPASFTVKIPVNDVDDFSGRPMQYKELHNDACSWQFPSGIFYSVVVHCDEPRKPIALIKYVWFKKEIFRWLYDEEGTPYPCTLEEYTYKVFGEQLVVNPEFRNLVPDKDQHLRTQINEII